MKPMIRDLDRSEKWDGAQRAFVTGARTSSNTVPGSTLAKKPSIETGWTTCASTRTHSKVAESIQSFPAIPVSALVSRLDG